MRQWVTAYGEKYGETSPIFSTSYSYLYACHLLPRFSTMIDFYPSGVVDQHILFLLQFVLNIVPYHRNRKLNYK